MIARWPRFNFICCEMQIHFMILFLTTDCTVDGSWIWLYCPMVTWVCKVTQRFFILIVFLLFRQSKFTTNICNESKSTLAAEFYFKNRYTFENCDDPCQTMIINAVNTYNKPKPDKIEVKIIFRNKIEVSKDILVQSINSLGEKFILHISFFNELVYSW